MCHAVGDSINLPPHSDNKYIMTQKSPNPRTQENRSSKTRAATIKNKLCPHLTMSL